MASALEQLLQDEPGIEAPSVQGTSALEQLLQKGGAQERPSALRQLVEEPVAPPPPRSQRSITHEIEELDKPTPQEVATQTPRGIPIVPSQFRPELETGRITEDIISGLRRPAEAVKAGIVELQEQEAAGTALISPLIFGVLKMIGIEEGDPDFTEVGARMASGFLGEETPASKIVDNFMGPWKADEPKYVTGLRATAEGFFEIAPDPLIYAPEATVLKWTKRIAKAVGPTESAKILKAAQKELKQFADLANAGKIEFEPIGKLIPKAEEAAKPILVSAKRSDDIIFLSFDRAAKKVPTPDEIRTFLQESIPDTDFSVIQFKGDVPSATRGIVNYRIDVHKPGMSKQAAKEAYQSLTGQEGRVSSKSKIERAMPVEERFKTIVDVGLEQELRTKPTLTPLSTEAKQTQLRLSGVPEPTPKEVLRSPTKAENTLKARINIVRRDIGIGEDEYRQILRDTVDEDSLRRMNIDQLRTVENEMLVRKKSGGAPRELGDMMDELDRNIDLAGGHANERDIGLISYMLPAQKVVKGTNIYELTDAALKQQTIFESDFATSFRKAWGKDIKDESMARAVTQYLEGELPANLATPRVVELGEHTRGLYNVLFKEFNIDPNRFLQFYSPRIRKAGSLKRAFPHGIPSEIKFFGELERRGGLAELETNQIKLFSRYLRSGSRKKFLEPLVQELLPEIKTLPRGTQMYAREYLRSILGFPTRTEILMDNSLRRLGDVMNKVLPASKQIDTTGRLAMQSTSLLRDIVYTGGLGFKPGSAIKNLTQTTLTMAEVGYTWTARGAAQLFTAEGRALARNSGIFREFAPALEDVATKFGPRGALDITRDAGMFLFGSADRLNRSVTYLSARGKLLNILQNKKSIDRMLRHVDPQPLKRIKKFAKEGELVQAAEEYGRWVSDEVQFVYSKSATPLIFRNPIGRVGGIFGTWPINFGNYWVNVLKHKQFEKLARYIGAAYAISAGAKQANMDMTDWFMTGPLSTTLGGPVASMTKALYNTTIGATRELWKGATGAKTKYAKKQRVQGQREALRSLPVFIPGGVAAASAIRGITAKGLTPTEQFLKGIGLPVRPERRKRTIKRIR